MEGRDMDLDAHPSRLSVYWNPVKMNFLRSKQIKQVEPVQKWKQSQKLKLSQRLSQIRMQTHLSQKAFMVKDR